MVPRRIKNVFSFR